ncbi:MAG: HAMP domain-containing histidine kinase [Lachnospiraceae bacterium]|nr:HAMP domain-containing histidine kinase [Lachnospiraceae bacterium]
MKEYLRRQRIPILLLVLLDAIFLTIFLLYNIILEPFIYASILVLLFGLIILMVSYGRYKKKIECLRDYLSVDITAIDELPEPGDELESLCYAIIDKIKKECLDMEASHREQWSDSVDYYSTWIHQIKTPIAVMRMMLDEDTERDRKLSGELFRVEQYVEMVLNYVRLGDASMELVVKEYNLDLIIKECIRKFAPQFVARKLYMRYEPVEEGVITDKKWLAFIIEQILSNAVKYTYEGGVTITYNEGILNLADTGIGITPEDIPRIFEKGYTGYNGREESKSTGIGLYLCKKACDRLGIKFCVASEPGKGSVFKLDLNTYELKPE